MSCTQCFSGHVNSGNPQGKWDTVHGLRTYVSTPPGGTDSQGIIVIIPDAFGVDFVNNQVLADHYASAAKCLVYLPEFMDGKAAPVRCMLNMAHVFDEKVSMIWKSYYLFATIYDFVPFLIQNRAAICWPRITSFLQQVRKDKGASLPVGIAGFCWGGLHAIKLTHITGDTQTADGRPLADAFFAAHPSNLSIPGDIDHVARNLSIAIGDDDAVMSISQVRTAEKILKAKTDVESEVIVYPGAKHGFAVRASRAVPDSKETEQAEQAEKQAVSWFLKHFASFKTAP